MVICENGSKHTFRVYLPEAGQVELVGTFTDWRIRPLRMVREDTGWWEVTTDLPPGEHDFSYLVNSANWLADYAASGVKRNKFGGWISQIYVDSPVIVPMRAVTKMAA
jgi:1,4-alpha-glucan branching enzyme